MLGYVIRRLTRPTYGQHGIRLAVMAIASSAVLSCGTLCCSPQVGAASNGRWSVYPTTPDGQPDRSYFQPVMAAGSSYPDSVTVVNQTSNPLTFDLYAADAFNASGGGGFSLRRPTDPERGVGAWLHLQTDKVAVPAESGVVVPFTIDAPANAIPGYHVGGIVAEAAPSTVTRHGSIGVSLVQAVGTRVYARIIGPLHPSLSVGGVGFRVNHSVASQFGGPVDGSLQFTVKNTGNVPLSPKEIASASPLIGSGTVLLNRTEPQILPGNTVTLGAPFRSVVPFGQLSAHVRVVTSLGIRAADASQTVIPWGLILIVVVMAVGLVGWRWRRRVPPSRLGRNHGARQPGWPRSSHRRGEEWDSPPSPVPGASARP